MTRYLGKYLLHDLSRASVSTQTDPTEAQITADSGPDDFCYLGTIIAERRYSLGHNAIQPSLSCTSVDNFHILIALVSSTQHAMSCYNTAPVYAGHHYRAENAQNLCIHSRVFLIPKIQ